MLPFEGFFCDFEIFGGYKILAHLVGTLMHPTLANKLEAVIRIITSKVRRLRASDFSSGKCVVWCVFFGGRGEVLRCPLFVSYECNYETLFN